MSHLKTHRRAPRGFTLLETAIVLGVITSLLSAIWIAGTNIYQTRQAARAAQQIVEIVANFQDIYRNRPVDTGAGGVWGDLTGMAVTMSLFPPDTLPTGITCSGKTAATCNLLPTGPWMNTTIKVWGYQDNNGIIIQYANLTKDACNRLGTRIAADQPGLIFSDISGNQTWFNGTNHLLVSDIDTSCKRITSPYINVMYSMAK